MKSIGRWIPIVVAVLGMGILGVWVAANVNSLTADDFGRRWAAGGAVVAAVVGLARWGWKHSRTAASSTEANLITSTDWLRGSVREQWAVERRRRGLDAVDPIPLRWVSTNRSVLPVDHTNPHLREGAIRELVSAFRSNRCTGVVVIGRPGAGKTTFALLLLLELLSNPRDGDAVPVLLSAAAWDPRSQDLHEFVEFSLVQSYPMLEDRQFGRDCTKALAQGRFGRQWILPILDGLDELIDIERRALAVRKVREWSGQIIVTCKAEQYEELVHHTEQVLRADAVVEIVDVSGVDAARFLLEGRPEGTRRWASLLTELQRDGSLIATALNTPLLLSLVRSVYQDTSTDPSELVDETRFTSTEDIEDFLVGAFLPAAYADIVGQRDYDLRVHWLRYIACHLENRQTPNLAWWELTSLVPDRSRRGMRAALVGLLGGTAVGVPGGLIAGILVGVAATLIAGVGSAGGWVGVMVAASCGSVLVAVGFGDIGGLRFGIACGLVWIGAAVLMLVVTKGRSTYRLPRRLQLGGSISKRQVLAGGFFATIMGLACGVAFGAAGGRSAAIRGCIGGMTAVTAVLILAAIGRPYADRSSVAGPSESLRADRMWGVAFGSTFGLTCGIAFAVVAVPAGSTSDRSFGGWLAMGLALSVAGIATALLGVSSAGNYALAVALLSSRRKLPVALMPFLRDANERGILRQVGPLYQFRHRALSARLAAAPSILSNRREAPF